MAKDLIRYDLLVQDALKGVVRKVLTDAARDGLAGDHHFYVSFRTDLPGVRLSQRLREKYPQDMTIVLQHQFWDLGVTEHTFEVGLSFSGVPERLLVPFDALTGFFDPSVQFGLKFEIQGEGAEATDAAPEEPAEAAKPLLPIAPPVPRLAPKAEPAPAKEPRRPAPVDAAKNADATKNEEPAGEAAAQDAGAQVVSLDAFRKKT
ncbi:MAG TPA: ClpXP protease specificity-enhancing factor SspB [Beijerinckiaceae bacterium]|jgi:hypothetical protein